MISWPPSAFCKSKPVRAASSRYADRVWEDIMVGGPRHLSTFASTSHCSLPAPYIYCITHPLASSQFSLQHVFFRPFLGKQLLRQVHASKVAVYQPITIWSYHRAKRVLRPRRTPRPSSQPSCLTRLQILSWQRTRSST